MIGSPPFFCCCASPAWRAAPPPACLCPSSLPTARLALAMALPLPPHLALVVNGSPPSPSLPARCGHARAKSSSSRRSCSKLDRGAAVERRSRSRRMASDFESYMRDATDRNQSRVHHMLCSSAETSSVIAEWFYLLPFIYSLVGTRPASIVYKRKENLRAPLKAARRAATGRGLAGLSSTREPSAHEHTQAAQQEIDRL